MIYRQDRYGNPLSLLGYGCMRFTQKNGRVDMEKTEREIALAVELGVNYFDTAYIYPGSEAALGEILEKRGLRDRVNIATKLPHYLLKKPDSAEKYFQEELKRLRTDHVDYYLMHMLSGTEAWERLCGLGIREWLQEKKASGRIRQVGFSYHGNSETFQKLLTVCDWDFCQIQYNYMDEFSQAGRAGLLAAAGRGIPVVIMEPLRGGRLTDRLPGEARKLLETAGEKRSPAAWAFRWLFDQEEVTVVLSGMNSEEMVRENCRTASESGAGCLTPEEREAIEQAREIIRGKTKVGCTGCRYCMPCPHQVDIPGVFSAYNRLASEGTFSAEKEYFMCQLLRKTPTGAGNCIGCGACESHCPQHIEIRKELKNAGKALESWPVRVAAKAAGLLIRY